jgi:hypothetical protein
MILISRMIIPMMADSHIVDEIYLANIKQWATI